MSDLLTLERDDRSVYTLTIRRPEVRNALNAEAFRELVAACEQVGADDTARVLVLTGEGRAFSAGGDFEALQQLLDGDRAFAVIELENAAAGVSERRTLEEHLSFEAQIQAECVRAADFREGLDAFRSKRPPVFEGR